MIDFDDSDTVYDQSMDGAVPVGYPFPSAGQEWLRTISVMQQTVLFSGIRGMDGMRKQHPAKALIRFYRRSILISAFDGAALLNPWHPGGGDFTGPSIEHCSHSGDPTQPGSSQWFEYRRPGTQSHEPWAQSGDPWALMHGPVADDFLRARDEMPLHFFSHMMHAFEIVGYKHPDENIRKLFADVYVRMCHALHVWPETCEQMDARLGDTEQGWRAREDAAGSCST